MENSLVKLTGAVYRLAEYLPESDPLKNRIKEKALAILENKKPEDIDLLLNYFYVAHNQGWLNSSNWLIISAEYEKMIKSPKTVLPPSVAMDCKPQPRPKAITLAKPELPDRQTKIVEYLQKNQKAQVMDLQTVLPQVTKRTIRRDLDELLKMGVVARFGDFNGIFYKIKSSV